MKSGLEDRNNMRRLPGRLPEWRVVSMKSGLEDRNNVVLSACACSIWIGLNEVRPGRPEQSVCRAVRFQDVVQVSMKSGLEDRNNRVEFRSADRSRTVSMKSGLEDRNNPSTGTTTANTVPSLNEVRPGRPEQLEQVTRWLDGGPLRLNEVRPGRPEQSSEARCSTNCLGSLNEVRPGRPEQ